MDTRQGFQARTAEAEAKLTETLATVASAVDGQWCNPALLELLGGAGEGKVRESNGRRAQIAPYRAALSRGPAEQRVVGWRPFSFLRVPRARASARGPTSATPGRCCARGGSRGWRSSGMRRWCSSPSSVRTQH